jgi:transposase
MKTLPQPWTVAMEATIFTGWIYDHLLPHAAQVKVAHPVMLRAIAAAKKKNDKIDAGKIADCLRCDFLPDAIWLPQRFGIGAAPCAIGTCWYGKWCR